MTTFLSYIPCSPIMCNSLHEQLPNKTSSIILIHHDLFSLPNLSFFAMDLSFFLWDLWTSPFCYGPLVFCYGPLLFVMDLSFLLWTSLFCYGPIFFAMDLSFLLWTSLFSNVVSMFVLIP
mgnify:CR=1 FL=1